MNMLSDNFDLNATTEITSPYSEGRGLHVMLDGIINADEFNKSSKKILWIMKEPYGALPEFIGDGFQDRIDGKKKDSFNTWNRIALASYTILHCDNDLLALPLWKEYGNSLNQVAIINLKKNAGQSTTNMSRLKTYFQKDKRFSEIIINQINTIKPDIIIGANTLKILLPYLSNVTKLKFGHFAIGEMLFINTWHPANLRLTTIAYANLIAKRIREFNAGELFLE